MKNETKTKGEKRKLQMLSLKGVSKMLSSRNNTKTSAVAFILLMAVSAVVAILPAANAVTAVPDQKTYAYLSVMPKTTIGLGQELMVNLWVFPPMATPHYWSQAELRYENITITFTKPDGSTDTFMPQEPGGVLKPGQSERGGMIWFNYEPDQIGAWSVRFSFPGQTFYDKEGNVTYSIYFEPCTSPVTTFTVQQDPVQIWMPPVPLPTAYWERPISAANREWSQISGDWLQPQYDGLSTVTGWSFNPYSTGPNSAHILWKNEVSMGGIMGGDWGSLSYGAGGGTPPIIMAGKVYYNIPGTMFRCVDLRTGEILYTANGTVTLGHHLRSGGSATVPEQTESASPVGSLWELGSTQWKQYNPLTGTLLRTISNVPSTLLPRWTEGSEIVYTIHYWGFNTTIPNKLAGNYLVKWNLTKVTGNNWLTGVVWNVTLRLADGRAPGDGRTFPEVLCMADSVAIVAARNCENFFSAYDLNTGALLYTKTTDYIVMAFVGYGPYDYGPYVQFDSSRTLHGYDMKTGKELWTVQVGEYPWGSQLRRFFQAYGNIYTSTYDGHVYAIDAATGKIKWVDEGTGNNTETPFGTWAPYTGPVIADGKLYWGTSEHSPTQPRMRGNYMFCHDAYTGKFLWTIEGAISPNAIADGYIVGTSEYDGIQYCFGKGKTETTVSIQNDVITAGSSALIQGSVMDMSPAQAGTPAVSDAGMNEWMNYLHMQNATLINSPPAPEGVPVELRALGSDGTLVDLGTVTTNSYGQFSLMWAPPKADKYTVYAAFAESESYWSSSAATALGVEAAQESPKAPESPVNNSEVITYVVVGVVAIITAIAVATVLLLRKGKQ